MGNSIQVTSSEDSDNVKTSNLTKTQLTLYGSVMLPLTIVGLPLMIYLPPLYGELGIDLALMGVVLFAARFSDVITDPIIGILSDKTRTRMGRRKPWLILGSVPLMIMTYLLFVPPDDVGIGYFLICVALIYLVQTVLSIPYLSWGAELSGDYNERSKITTIRESSQYTGFLIASLVPVMVALFWGVEDLRSQLFYLAILICFLTPVVTLLASLFVPEAKISGDTIERFTIQQYKDGLRFMVKNDPFIRILIGVMGFTIGTSIDSVVSFFFCKHVLLAESSYAIALTTMMIAAVACLPIWLFISTKIGKHRTFIAAIIWYVTWSMVMPVLYFIPEWSAEGFIFLQTMKGMCIGAIGAMAGSMAADAIDLDTLQSGEPRTGFYFAMWGAAMKTAGAFAGFIGLTAVSLFGFDATLEPGLPADTGGNTLQALVGVILLYSLIPSFFYLGTLPWLWNYPLTEERQAEIRKQIEAR